MATSSQPRGGLAGKALKNAGLIKDEDASMRDLSKGGRNKPAKKAAHGHRQRSANIYKASGSADHKMVNTFDPFRSGHASLLSGRGVSPFSY